MRRLIIVAVFSVPMTGLLWMAGLSPSPGRNSPENATRHDSGLVTSSLGGPRLTSLGYGGASENVHTGSNLGVRVTRGVHPDLAPPHVTFRLSERNPHSGEWEVRKCVVTTPYIPWIVKSLNSHSFFVLGHSDSRGLVLERMDFPAQVGGWQSSRPGTPSPVGDSTTTAQFQESIVGGGIYVSQADRDMPIVKRTILIADHERGAPQALGLDANGRLALFVARDSRTLTSVDLKTLEEKDIASRSDYPQLMLTTNIWTVDFGPTDRGYWLPSTLTDYGGEPTGVLVGDHENDGVLDEVDLVREDDFYATPHTMYDH